MGKFIDQMKKSIQKVPTGPTLAQCNSERQIVLAQKL
jgi:hypothetical protein